MKRIVLHVVESSINRLIGGEAILCLSDQGTVLEAITEVDKRINAKGGFPLKEYGSLLHMVYNPTEDRFYTQIGVHAHRDSSERFDVKNTPHLVLPDGATVVLLPRAACAGDWEDAIDLEEFRRVISLKFTSV